MKPANALAMCIGPNVSSSTTYNQAALASDQVNMVLATNLPSTNCQRDTGHASVTSSTPVLRSSAKERIATTGATTMNVVSMLVKYRSRSGSW